MVMWGFLLLYAPYHAGRGDNVVLLSDGMNEERGDTNIEWHLCQRLFGLSRWISVGSGGYEKNNNETSVSNGRIFQHKGAEKNDGTPSNNSEGNDEEDEDDTTINSRQ